MFFDRQNGQPIRVLVGVVIQEMVKSEVSGVLFTNHPVTGSADHMVIDASYGLGEVRKIFVVLHENPYFVITYGGSMVVAIFWTVLISFRM